MNENVAFRPKALYIACSWYFEVEWCPMRKVLGGAAWVPLVVKRLCLSSVVVLSAHASCSSVQTEPWVTDPKGIVDCLVQASGVSREIVGQIESQFIEHYNSESEKMGRLDMNSEALELEFKRADAVLSDAVKALSSRAEKDFRSCLKKLKELTEDGFYQAANLHSYGVSADKRADVKALIQTYWQLLWQAREIMTFEVTAGWSRDDKYHFSDLLVDLSSAIDWVANRSSLLKDGEKAARVSQIAFCLGARLGNEAAAEEIRTYDDGLEVEQYWRQLSTENRGILSEFEELDHGDLLDGK